MSIGRAAAESRLRRIPASARWLVCVLALSMAQGAGAASIPRSPNPSTPISHADPLLKQQGGGAGVSVGDYISNSDDTADGGDGLDDAYRYWIEVPPGTSRLMVDIFDADVGDGGFDEADEGRDRVRGGGDWNTTVQYRLFDPDGNQVPTNFTFGDDDNPAGADNAWLTLYDSNNVSGGNGDFVNVTTAEDDDDNDLTVNFGAVPNGDLLVATLVKQDDDDQINIPTGWTVLSRGACDGGGDSCRMGVFYRIADGTQGASVTMTVTGGDTKLAGAVLQYTGIDTTTPVDVFAVNVDDGTSAVAPSVTTTVANTRIVRIIGVGDNSLDGTPYPVGHDGRHAIEVGGGGDDIASASADTFQAAIGATGAAAFDLDDFENYRAVTIAFRTTPPSPGSATPGHWRLEVDSSDSGGDNIVSYGVRAHDGDASSGGTELAIYGEPYLAFGINTESGPTDQFVLYPYLSGGCTVDSNDFDMDDNNTGNQGQINLATRQGNSILFVDDPAMSNNNDWNSESSSPFDTNQFQNTDHGIGRGQYNVSDFPGNSNYTVWYLSDPDTTDIPPDSIDEPGYRIYFPPDGADADDPPVKPYLEQALTYVSGTNPPADGETTVVQITVRLVNPTANDITFSGSNVVTAHVPSNGRVEYVGGSWSASTGTLAGGEPSDGASGVDIEWDPVTAAAGETEIMTYQLRVTPQADNETIFVTGQPSTNGTRAIWLDETQNSSQARATYTFGQLCGLSATADVSITYVSLSSFRAYSDGAGARVEWETASEAGTAGFYLRRRDPDSGRFRRVPGARVRGLLTSPEGGTYSVVDPDAVSGQSYTYRLVEIQTNGRRHAYGPFTVTVDGEPADLGEKPEQLDAGAQPGVRSFGAGLQMFSQSRSRDDDDDRNEFDELREWKGEGANARREHRHRSERSKRRAWFVKERLRQAREHRRFFGGGDQAQLTLTETGLYEVSASELTSAMGQNEYRVRSAIKRGALEIRNRGTTVRYRSLDHGGGLVFFGEAVDSPYTDENVYWIDLDRSGDNLMTEQGESEDDGDRRGGADGSFGRRDDDRGNGRGNGWGLGRIRSFFDSGILHFSNFGRRGFGDDDRNEGRQSLQEQEEESGADVEPARSFTDSVHVEQDVFAGPVVAVNRGRSFWYWKVIAFGNSSSFDVPTPGVTGTGIATLEVHVQGALSGPSLNEHGAEVYVNGNLVGSGGWDDTASHTMRFEFDQALLTADNVVQVVSTPTSGFYFDGFDISYERSTTARDGMLLVRNGNHQRLAVDGFLGDEIQVYEVSSPGSPVVLVNAEVGSGPGGYEVTFDAVPGGRYLAVETGNEQSPVSIQSDSPTTLRDPRNRADYVVIAPEVLKTSAETLAGYRASDGMNTRVVLLEDVYDEFNFGLRDPYAVRDFLSYAYGSWRQAPRYVVFLGKGTYDYKDVMEQGTNLFPPVVLSTPDGMFAADAYTLDVAGGDGVPEFAGGRIPVTSDEEFNAYFNKLVASEGYSGAWSNNVIVSAEVQDGAADFKADAQVMTGLLGGQGLTELYLDDISVAQARSDLFTGLNDTGAAVYTHVGHGGTDRLAAGGVLKTIDVGSQLSNSGKLPFLVALSCLINRYEVPGFDPVLGEELILNPDSGAAAVWAPTGTSAHAAAALLGQELFRSLYANGTGRVGDAVVEALDAFRDVSTSGAMQFYVYTLLGDPAARIGGMPAMVQSGPSNYPSGETVSRYSSRAE